MNITQTFLNKAVTTGLLGVVMVLGIAINTANAHQDPDTCSANGVGLSLSVFRSDGTTVIGGGDTVTSGEVIKYQTTLNVLGLPACNFSLGTLTITTPDGVTDVTPIGGIPLVSVGNPFVSALVSYTVDSADVGGDGDIDASTNYSGGQSHIGDIHDTATGSATKQTLFLKLSPTISTIPSAGGVIGTVLNDTATLSGGSSPTGNVTFKLFPPSDATCSSTEVFSQVDGEAPYTTGPGYTSLVSGIYRWTADYAGDANNNAVSSGCQEEQVTIVAQGHIIVNKVTNPAGDSQSFNFVVGGTGYNNFALTDTAIPNDQTLNAGSYSVSETLPSGWTQTSAVCVSSIEDTESIGSLELDAGETITCTFTNTKKGHIIVNKITNPVADQQSFNFTAGGAGYNSFSLTDAAAPNNQEVLPGAYSVSEGAVANWSSDGGVCDNGETPASIDVGAGETITCTFTNTYTPPAGKIIVVKQTNPEGDLQSFEFDSNYDEANFNLADNAQNDSGDLVAGTYSVAEVNIPANWALSSATCSDQSPVNAISLQAGETVTCTFTNTYTPPAGEWCSPGYWRQEHHYDSWEPTGYDKDSLYLALDGEPALKAPKGKGKNAGAFDSNPTMWEVLQSPQLYGGDAFNFVGDALSGAHPDVNFNGGERIEDCPLN